MISGCKFTKGMNAAQVLITIVEAFDEKIPRGVDIEILMSMHTKLVSPTLAPGQLGIDGAILQRLFQTKPIYVRPSKQILAMTDLMGDEVEENASKQLDSKEKGTEDAYMSDDDLDLLVSMADGKPVICN